MKSVVSEKGQVTIPKKLRDRLGIRPGQVIEFVEDAGKLVGVKVEIDNAARVRSLIGVSDLNMTTAEFLEWVRGPRDDLDY